MDGRTSRLTIKLTGVVAKRHIDNSYPDGGYNVRVERQVRRLRLKMKHMFGWLLILLPFTAITVYVIKEAGWFVAIKIWAITLLIVGILVAGCYLLVA